VKDTYLATIRFWHEHLEEPLANIWATIRYDKKTLTVVDPISLEKSAESLVSMVEQCYEDQGIHMSPIEKQDVREQVHRGDISQIMKIYEDGIRHPIKSALFGELIRVILIQVQKEKVDVERALVALDKLLKANELNFQFLATIPAVLLMGLTILQVRRLLTISKSYYDVHSAIRSDLRGLERMLTAIQNSPGSSEYCDKMLTVGGLSMESYGYLVCITTKLYDMASRLPVQQERLWFVEDLHELEAEETNSNQKLATLQRMYHTHPFLLPNYRSVKYK